MLEEQSMIEITLGITPRNPRLHTKGSFNHTKTIVLLEISIHSFIDSPRLNTTIYTYSVCVFLGTLNSWNYHLVNDVACKLTTWTDLLTTIGKCNIS